LLLEAGGPDYRLDFRTQMPAALAFPLQGRRYNWAFETDPEPHMDNRRMECGRGKGLGGSSLINGMCYIRGNAMDFDNWAKAPGLEDWSYLDCLPYFRKAETRDIGPNDYHGGDGPVSVTTPKAGNNELFHAMVEAGVQAGYPRTEDLNGYQQEGFGPMDRTVTPNGRRASTARGYLDRPSSAFDPENRHSRPDRPHPVRGQACGGRDYLQGESNQITSARARGSVAVQRCDCLAADFATFRRWPSAAAEQPRHPGGARPAGRWREPAGPPGNVPAIRLHPAGVAVPVAALVQPAEAIGAEWLFNGTGIGASNQFEAGGFIRTREEFAWPNIQYHFLPVAINYNGSNG
jgi:choline dehydrogenase